MNNIVHICIVCSLINNGKILNTFDSVWVYTYMFEHNKLNQYLPSHESQLDLYHIYIYIYMPITDGPFAVLNNEWEDYKLRQRQQQQINP